MGLAVMRGNAELPGLSPRIAIWLFARLPIQNRYAPRLCGRSEGGVLGRSLHTMDPSSILVWDLVQLYRTPWLMRTAFSQRNTAVMKVMFHSNLNQHRTVGENGFYLSQWRHRVHSGRVEATRAKG